MCYTEAKGQQDNTALPDFHKKLDNAEISEKIRGTCISIVACK